MDCKVLDCKLVETLQAIIESWDFRNLLPTAPVYRGLNPFTRKQKQRSVDNGTNACLQLTIQTGRRTNNLFSIG
jgi:hypothetical protein